MKQIVEVSGEGLEKFMGDRITLFCSRYIYTGKLVGVNECYVKLSDAGIVYETGELTDGKWKDCQKLQKDWYVTIQSIESYGALK